MKYLIQYFVITVMLATLGACADLIVKDADVNWDSEHVELEAKLVAADGEARNYFGNSVSLDGNTAVIGAHGDNDLGWQSGSAYVYVRNPGNNTWSLQSKLLASDGVEGDYYGTASIDGNTIVIGASKDDDNWPGAGSAYVYVRNPANGTWTQQAKLTASDSAAYDSFGTSVSISGDTVVINSLLDDDRGNNSGSAYVFVRNPTTGTWSQQAKLLASDGTADHNFGGSISFDGNTVVIGAKFDNNLGVKAGSAYVFVRNPTTGTWAQQAKLLASDGSAGNYFGNSVSIDGNTVIIAAQNEIDSGHNISVAYIYERNPTTGTWTQQAKLVGADAPPYNLHNFSVAIDNDTAVLASYYSDAPGKAYTFVRNPVTGTWTQQAEFTAADSMPGDGFGFDTSINGKTILIGARYDDDQGESSGSAYIFHVDEPKTAKAVIKNNSLFSAGEFLVYFDADENPVSQNHRPQVRHHVNSLAGGEEIELEADFTPLAHPDNSYLANVCQITVRADPKDQVREFNENNNILTLPVTSNNGPKVAAYNIGPTTNWAINTYNPVSQTFIATQTGVLKGVELTMLRCNAPSWIEARVFFHGGQLEAEANVPAQNIPGPQQCNGAPAQLNFCTIGTVFFDMSVYNVNVVAGQEYSFTVDTQNEYELRVGYNTDVYTDGVGSQGGGTTNNDLVFKVLVE